MSSEGSSSGHDEERAGARPGTDRPAAVHHGQGDIYVARRDIRIRYEDGVHETLRSQTLHADHACPFPGLAAFTWDQSEWFFGRDRLLADLVDRLDHRMRNGGIQMVVGPSGAGKSSLLQAGLAAKLRDTALPASGTWAQLVLTPTADPVGALVSAIRALAPDPSDESLPSHAARSAKGMTRKMAADPTRCLGLLKRALDGLAASGTADEQIGGPRAVLIVDQFEELFTLCPSEERRTTFIDLLSRIAETGSDGGPAALVVIGLRADFLGQCLTHAPLRAAVENHLVTVGPMAENELREAILFPARRAHLEMDAGLVDILLRDLGVSTDDARSAGYEPGRLPLLAHALRATWQQRSGSALTVHGYKTTGGISGAVAKTADRVYQRLDSAEKKASRLLFLRLVRIGEGTDDVRRRLPREEAVGNGTDSGAADTALEAFSMARLITQDRDTVEVTHEVLIHAWPQLREWIDSNRSGRLIHQELEESAAAWKRRHEHRSKLLTGPDLQAADRWSQDSANQADASPRAREFLNASLRASSRARRVSRLVIIALISLTVITLAAAVKALVEAKEADTANGIAEQQRNSAVHGQLIAEYEQLKQSDSTVAAQLNVAAHLMQPTSQTRSRLITDANRPLSTVVDNVSSDIVAFRPTDGTALAAGGRTLLMLDRNDFQHPAPLRMSGADESRHVRSMAFSKDGRTLLSVGLDTESIDMYQWGDGRGNVPSTHTLDLSDDEMSGPSTVTLSADGRTVAVGFDSGGIRLANIEDPARPIVLGKSIRTGHGSFAGLSTENGSLLRGFKDGGAPRDIAFSPDGRLLAALVQEEVLIWNVTDLAHPVAAANSPLALPATSSGLLALDNGRTLAFSPDSRTLAVGSYDGTVSVVALAGRQDPVVLGRAFSRPRAHASTVAFGPGGQTLAVGRDDGVVQIWNVSDSKAPKVLHESLAGHTAPVSSVSFSYDGTALATASIDQEVRIWKIPTTSLMGHTGAVTSLAFTGDGRTLATGSEDRTARLWNLTDPQRLTRSGKALAGHSAAITSVAFSHDGATLVTGSALGWDVRLWQVADPSHAEALGKPLRAAATPVDAVATSPVRRILATSTTTGWIVLWRVSTDAPPVQLGKGTLGLSIGDIGISALAFSADGRTLAAGGTDGLVHLWDVSDPENPALRGDPLAAHTDSVTSVAFSPDGHTLASGSNDRTVRLWDVSDPDDPALQGDPLTAHTDSVTSVAFSPDGHTLASGSNDRTVRLWPLDLAEAVRNICESANTAHYRREWSRIMGDDLPYEPSCETP
ncbi:NACHT and WD repeat domain-containing protein [Streptomyces tendae]|uniref:NACHT and WD repeat domain-containing protein n=1 Tax=Streptomyces tendae TaxID=1932 RepID=UPI003D74837C